MNPSRFVLFTAGSAAILATLTSLSAATIDFTSYADGDLVGQNGWNDDTGYFTVTTGVGAKQVAGGWNKGVERTFTDLEVGGAFDTNSSIVEYSFTFDPGTKVGGQYTGMSFSIGDDFTNPSRTEIDLHVIPIGLFKIHDGVKSGNDEYFDGFGAGDQWAENTDVTITLRLDYGNSTYSATRSDLPSSVRTDYAFVKGIGGSGAYNVRFSATQLQSAPTLKSMSINLVPEPSSMLLVSLSGLFLLRRNRK